MFIFTEWHASQFVPSPWDGVLGMAVLGAGRGVRVGECVCVSEKGWGRATWQAVSHQANGLHFFKISICHRGSVCRIKLSVILCERHEGIV